MSDLTASARQTLDRIEQPYLDNRSDYALRLVSAVKECRKVLDSLDANQASWIEAREDAHARAIERERDKVTRAEKALANLRNERTVTESRAADPDDETRVRITMDRPNAGGWRIADLEEVAYRLRTAGAEDETLVEVEKHWIKANVPDPSMVTLARRPRMMPPAPPEPPEPSEIGPLGRVAIVATACMLLVAVTCLLVWVIA